MRQLQNDPEKIRSFYQNHRSNMPSDSAFTYGLINTSLKAFTLAQMSKKKKNQSAKSARPNKTARFTAPKTAMGCQSQ